MSADGVGLVGVAEFSRAFWQRRHAAPILAVPRDNRAQLMLALSAGPIREEAAFKTRRSSVLLTLPPSLHGAAQSMVTQNALELLSARACASGPRMCQKISAGPDAERRIFRRMGVG